jgi:hypothetical protein
MHSKFPEENKNAWLKASVPRNIRASKIDVETKLRINGETEFRA